MRTKDRRSPRSLAKFTPEDRYVALAAIILWASESGKKKVGLQSWRSCRMPNPVVKLAQEVFWQMLERKRADLEKVYPISLNRRSMPALSKSVAAVKGDAVRNVFEVKCRDIGWAVLDSGIDATHPAFHDDKGKTRVKAPPMISAT